MQQRPTVTSVNELLQPDTLAVDTYRPEVHDISAAPRRRGGRSRNPVKESEFDKSRDVGIIAQHFKNGRVVKSGNAEAQHRCNRRRGQRRPHLTTVENLLQSPLAALSGLTSEQGIAQETR
jgi:hypothetical protein